MRSKHIDYLKETFPKTLVSLGRHQNVNKKETPVSKNVNKKENPVSKILCQQLFIDPMGTILVMVYK